MVYVSHVNDYMIGGGDDEAFLPAGFDNRKLHDLAPYCANQPIGQ